MESIGLKEIDMASYKKTVERSRTDATRFVDLSGLLMLFIKDAIFGLPWRAPVSKSKTRTNG